MKSFVVVAIVVMYLSMVNAMSIIKANDKIPMAQLHFGFPPQMVNTASYAANKNMIIVGLPGAFTPT
jgi:peroxiredoxin